MDDKWPILYIIGNEQQAMKVMRIVSSIDEMTEWLLAGCKLYAVCDSLREACQLAYLIAQGQGKSPRA